METVAEEGGIPAYQHVPVFLERTLELLEPAIFPGRASVLIDGTLGMGGHAQALLEKHRNLRILGFDRDEQARNIAARRLRRYGDRIRIVPRTYDKIRETLDEEDLGAVQGILLDLGVSSLQLDTPERGFSYSKDAPLDMRMELGAGVSAYDVVNEYSEEGLRRILKQYGDEKFAGKIAHGIVCRRTVKPLETTCELVEVVKASIPVRARLTGGHPAKRSFQAIRIEVNDELGLLRSAVGQALEALAVSGRMVVLAYQSLEDKIIKQAFTAAASSKTPKGFPVELPEHKPQFRILTKREIPRKEEILKNPRAAAARLRAIERIERRKPCRITPQAF